MPTGCTLFLGPRVSSEVDSPLTCANITSWLRHSPSVSISSIVSGYRLTNRMNPTPSSCLDGCFHGTFTPLCLSIIRPTQPLGPVRDRRAVRYSRTTHAYSLRLLVQSDHCFYPDIRYLSERTMGQVVINCTLLCALLFLERPFGRHDHTKRCFFSRVHGPRILRQCVQAQT